MSVRHRFNPPGEASRFVSAPRPWQTAVAAMSSVPDCVRETASAGPREQQVAAYPDVVACDFAIADRRYGITLRASL